MAKRPRTPSSGSKSPATKKPAAKSTAATASTASTSAATSAASKRSKAIAAAKAARAAAAAAAKAAEEAGMNYEDLFPEASAPQGTSAAPEPEPEDTQPDYGTEPWMGENENYLDFLTRMFNDMSSSQWDPETFDGMSRGVGMVLGSGPAFAALESMLANTSAQSAVLMNAAERQRQLDQVGLCCTSACVKQLLNLNNGQDSD